MPPPLPPVVLYDTSAQEVQFEPNTDSLLTAALVLVKYLRLDVSADDPVLPYSMYTLNQIFSQCSKTKRKQATHGIAFAAIVLYSSGCTRSPRCEFCHVVRASTLHGLPSITLFFKFAPVLTSLTRSKTWCTGSLASSRDRR